MQLNKTQLNEVIKASIIIQNRILDRKETDQKAIEFSNHQFLFFKSLYKTAFHYYCNQSGHTLDGIAYLDYSDLVDWYENSLPKIDLKQAL